MLAKTTLSLTNLLYPVNKSMFGYKNNVFGMGAVTENNSGVLQTNVLRFIFYIYFFSAWNRRERVDHLAKN